MLTLFEVGDTINNVKNNKQGQSAGKNEVNAMKQVKLSDVKRVLCCDNNNELVSVLMGLYISRILEAQNEGDEETKEFYLKRWNSLYELLDNQGYYDEFKNK